MPPKRQVREVSTGAKAKVPPKLEEKSALRSPYAGAMPREALEIRSRKRPGDKLASTDVDLRISSETASEIQRKIPSPHDSDHRAVPLAQAKAQGSAHGAVAGDSVLPQVELLRQATETIGSEEAAMRWMGTPVRALNYATPISMLHDASGFEAVRVVLGRLEHGVL